MRKFIDQQFEYWKGVKFANYWHAEIIFIVPLCIWFIWAFHKVINLLEQILAALS